MYCPQCRVEYREGFTECVDCRAPLLAGSPPPEQPSDFDPGLDLVVVLETNNAIQLAMAKGSLDEAGVPYFVLDQITTLVNDVDGFLRKWVRIQVPRDRESEAREIIEAVIEPEESPEITES